MSIHYVGLRYTMKFYDDGNGGCEWTSTVPFEYFTVVTHEGNSFTSKKNVPIGIELTNTEFWCKTSDYNAQIAIYKNLLDGKAEQSALDTTNTTVSNLVGQMGAANGNITQLQTDITTKAKQTDVDTISSNVASLQSIIGTKAANSDLTVTNNNLNSLSSSVANLQADVNTRAKQSDLNTTNSNVSTLQTQINSKAAQSSLDSTNNTLSTLQTSVTHAWDAIGYNTPPGVVQMFLCAPAANSGWLELNGQWVSKTTYVNLYNAIKTLVYEDSSHAGLFQLPNFEDGNKFPRAAGGTKPVGTKEGYNAPNHRHTQTMRFHSDNYTAGSGALYGDGATVVNDVIYGGLPEQYDGTEVRPNAYSVIMCVKY